MTTVATTIAARRAAPSPFDDPMPFSQIAFSFQGRVPRKVFWLYGVLGPLLLSSMIELLLGIVGVGERSAQLVATLLLAWPCAAVAAKRWHDRDRSGWWVLVLLIPLVGLVWSLVVNGLRRGTVGPNRYGADLTAEF
jgi:uncharacterized membrane protein YhaH (DUF805 family)